MQFKAGKILKPFHYISSLYKNKLLDYPYLAIIETTNTCNLKCPTCPTPREKLCREPRVMNLDEFKTIIDKIKDKVHIVLLYNSNEPLIHPDLHEMVRYCDKNNLYTMISTNATLLDKLKTEQLFNSGLDEILLCLDGTSKKAYEEFRLGANFEEVAKNINYFCKEKKKRELARPYIELQFILNKLNQKQIPEIKKWSKVWDVNRLRIKSFGLAEYAYSREEIKELSEKFLPEKIEDENYKNKMIHQKEDGEVKMKRSNKKCSLAKDQLVVLADGSVAMCCYDISGKFIYGNLLEDNFEKIWNSSENQKRRKLAEEKKYPLCNICGEY